MTKGQEKSNKNNKQKLTTKEKQEKKEAEWNRKEKINFLIINKEMLNSKKEYVYPKIWNDDDIIRFKYYLKEAKSMYDLPDDLIELCVEHQINEEKGLVKPIDFSQIKDLEITTPPFEKFETVIEQEA